MAQPRWDEQEVALLLDAYLRIEAGSSQKTVAEELSDTLRLRAVNRGFDIDDQFRNVNGMIMQLSNMQFVMTDGKRGLYGASSLIREVVQKRKADPQWFDQLLREAKASVTSSDIQRKSASTSQSENLSVKASALQKEELCVSEVQSHEDRFYEWLASGIIVRRKLQLEDNDLLSLILADSGVELKQEPALNWLYENGYIPSHTKSWASESILRRAKLIREEREK